jgi:phosphate/sulfate permease
MDYSFLLIAVIALALIFDFINGFHDAANSIATVVSTKVLTPFQAVVWAAFFNFVAFFIFKDHSVATTIAKSVHKEFIVECMHPLSMILAGLMSAVAWNLITWWYGIPSSSSHTLIGGFAGAFLAAFGWKAISSGIIWATAIFIVVAPIAGMIMSYLISIWFLNSFRKGIWMKLVSLTIIFGVSYAVFNVLEFKKDFNGGSSYVVSLSDKVEKDKLKEMLVFKSEDKMKEFPSLVKVAKDSAGNEDASGKLYEIRTDYLKDVNSSDENKDLTKAIKKSLDKSFKKDLRSGLALVVKTDAPISSSELKKAFSLKNECDKAIVFVEPAKDSLGLDITTNQDYIVRLDSLGSVLYANDKNVEVLKDLKKQGVNSYEVVSTDIITKDSENRFAYSTQYQIVKVERIGADSKLRFDTSNLKNNFETYWLKVMFHGANFKWVLLGFIVVVIGIFTLFMSSMNNSRANKWFKKLQLFSSAAFSIGHGGNDAQKVMGIITVALIAGGEITSLKEMPNWVPLACYAAIALGTMSGGWKIVKTMGNKITKVTPFEGVAAETAGAITLFFTEGLKFPWKMGGEVVKGIPVSTTHTITGSIIGVGITKRISAVKWGVTGKLLVAWIITIPISAGLGALFYYIMHLCGVNA